MAIWPSQLDFGAQNWAYEPSVAHTSFATNNTRQRLIITDNDYRFGVTMKLDEAELAVFEAFVLNDLNQGADEYTGPYYVNDTEYTGTLQIVDGRYNVNYLAVNYWEVSYEFEVKGRDMANENNAYDLVVEMDGFGPLCDLTDALENAINTSDYYE